MMRRREVLVGVGAGLIVTPALAGPPMDTRLENRLTLWKEYSSRTDNLLARTSTTRETSLLVEPLVTTGSLLFVAPGTLVFRDDSANGSTTVIDAGGTRLIPNRDDLPFGPETPIGTRPAADWMAERLTRLFAPVEPALVIENCRTNVPKGRGYKLDLLPPRGSAIRRVVRSLTITMDPAVGSIQRIAIAEAQGDRVTIAISDHRQNVAAQDAASITGPLARRGIQIAIE